MSIEGLSERADWGKIFESNYHHYIANQLSEAEKRRKRKINIAMRIAWRSPETIVRLQTPVLTAFQTFPGSIP
jgi:hypothetical protein